MWVPEILAPRPSARPVNPQMQRPNREPNGAMLSHAILPRHPASGRITSDSPAEWSENTPARPSCALRARGKSKVKA